MTTVAYKDGVLATDTLTCWGSSRDGYCIKARKLGPYLAAVSGALPPAQRFLDWFQGGLKGDPPEMPSGEHQTHGFIITPDGVQAMFSHLGWERTMAASYAMGSGAEYAQGAMAMGASAEQAVRIAMQFDTKTGGDITVLRH